MHWKLIDKKFLFIQLFVQMANMVKTVVPVCFSLGLFWLANAEEVHLLFSLSWLGSGFYGFCFVCPAKCENKHAVMAQIPYKAIHVQNVWYHSESCNLVNEKDRECWQTWASLTLSLTCNLSSSWVGTSASESRYNNSPLGCQTNKHNQSILYTGIFSCFYS